MKPIPTPNKKLLFIVFEVIGITTLILATYFISGVVLLKLGSVSYQNKNYKSAEEFYNAAHKFHFIRTKVEDRLNNMKNEISEFQTIPKDSTIRVTVPTDNIKILNNIVLKGSIENFSDKIDPPDYYRRYLLSAMLKNTSPHGIPAVKIKKLNIYDSAGKLVMTKDSPIQDVILVKDGETPFTYYFNLRETHKISITSFSLELEIPPFTPNPDVVRLMNSDLTLISKNPATEGSKSYKYRFQLTLQNPTSSLIKDIYRISFLTFDGKPLTRSGHECCMGLDTVKEVNETGDVIRMEDISKSDDPLVFLPGEKKIVAVEMIVDEAFNEFGNQFTYNPDQVEPTIIVIGTKE